MCSVPYKNNLLIAYWLSFQEAQHWVCLNASVCDVETRKYLYVLYYKKCCSCISEWRGTEVTHVLKLPQDQKSEISFYNILHLLTQHLMLWFNLLSLLEKHWKLKYISIFVFIIQFFWKETSHLIKAPWFLSVDSSSALQGCVWFHYLCRWRFSPLQTSNRWNTHRSWSCYGPFFHHK